MRVAIAGYGIEGKANLEYWRALGHDITVVDERHELSDLSPDVPSILGPGSFENLSDFDMVVRTAGLAPTRIKTNGVIWSATNEFFEKCPADIIGVTGTKGKGTTASLIASILRAAGKTVHLVGNIGVPALEVLPQIQQQDIVVYELSSFQLWDIKKSPHIAVVLMIEPDHLDVHANLKDYIDAKANIIRYQSTEDTAIYLSSASSYTEGIVEVSKGQKIPYPDQRYAHVVDADFWYGEQYLCPIDVLKLPGKHNVENTCAAITAIYRYTQDADAIAEGIQTFEGLPHRLKLVDEFTGVRYYDDSISTTPGSAMAAIDSFEEPKLLILGGKDKGSDYSELISRCKSTTTHVLSIGANGQSIAELCKQNGVTVTELSGKNMGEIVQTAASLAVPGNVVVLSPAAASFDMFKSYSDRGDHFVAAVKALS